MQLEELTDYFATQPKQTVYYYVVYDGDTADLRCIEGSLACLVVLLDSYTYIGHHHEFKLIPCFRKTYVTV